MLYSRMAKNAMNDNAYTYGKLKKTKMMLNNDYVSHKIDYTLPMLTGYHSKTDCQFG